MDLKSVLSRVGGKSPEPSASQEYLAIKISSTEVLATVWTVTDGRVVVEKSGGDKIGGPGYEALLQAADAAVSTCLGERQLPGVQTIFGVSPDWADDGKIIPEKLQILRKLCKDLDLRPLGYVQLFEALENYLKETEGAPLTAILVGLDGDNGWVTVFRAGKNLGTFPLSSGEHIAVRVESALREFTQLEVLPARIILYDGRRDLKDLEEKITAHPWTKSLPFLHFPRVEVISGDLLVKAVAIAGGTQMGGKIEMAGEPEAPAPEPGQQTESEVAEISAEEAGFFQEIPQAGITVPKVNISLPKVSLPKFSFPKVTLPKNKPLALMAGVALAAVVLAVGLVIYFVPKATVLVHVASRTFDHEMEATISGELAEVTEIGTKKSVATGKKLVGDKARGTVTVYSAAGSKLFPAGTAIASPDGLKFVFDQDTNVASASDFLTPSTVTAKVTAADIGDKYNLSSGTKFTISGATSSYLAKSDTNFTGGNSHEATVVTKNDQDRLMATLSAELTQRAEADLNAKLESGQTLLPNAITSQVSKKRFSKDIDAEADNVSLDLTMDFKGVTASSDDLIARFLERFGNDIPSGYRLAKETARPEIKSTKLDKAGNAVLAVRLNASMVPLLELDELAKQIAGQSAAVASGIFTGHSGVNSIEIEVKPEFFQSLIERFLPWRIGNIQIETVSD